MRLQWGIMKSNRICIMAWAQEIDRSISSASYHVQCIAGVCVSGAQADGGKLSEKFMQQIALQIFPSSIEINDVLHKWAHHTTVQFDYSVPIPARNR
jgi:hypothetical protein